MPRIDRSIYKDGIQFQCQGSGKCCRFRDNYDHVYVSLSERRQLAQHLGMRTSSFTRKYCEVSDGSYQLRSADSACVFLSGSRCSVYEARPQQCRSWPFWPENMNRRAWREVVEFCPGIGRGNLLSAKTIERYLDEETLEEKT